MRYGCSTRMLPAFYAFAGTKSADVAAAAAIEGASAAAPSKPPKKSRAKQ